MTDPNVERMVRLDQLAKLISDGVVTTSEALARVRADRELLVGGTVARMAEDTWQLARTNRDFGCMMTGLLYEWTVTHATDDPVAVFASGRAFVRAATEVLVARDDADLYRRANQASEMMIASATPTATPAAHYTAGRLHLAPYALDPVNHHHDYVFSDHSDFGFNRMYREQLERNSSSTYRLQEHLMPGPAVGLDRAVHHLAVAVRGFTGETRGEVLAHLAFAEYSRYLAGRSSLAEVDRWCDESVALLPPDGEPLACNRLLWLHLLRSRPDRVAGRPIAAPGELMTDGLVYTVLVAVTAVRLLSMVVFQAGACRAILDVAWPLVSDDPDLRAQRRYLDLMGTHALPDDPVGCRARQQGTEPTPAQERDLSGTALAASRVHGLLCGPSTEEPAAEAATLDAVLAYAPRLEGRLRVVLAHRKWMAAVRALDQRGDLKIPALIDAVTALARTDSHDLAMVALTMLEGAMRPESEESTDIDAREVMPALLLMTDAVFTLLPEAGWRMAGHCLSMLLAHWFEPTTINATLYVMATMNVLKGRALSGALARPGPASPEPEIDRAVALLAELRTDSEIAPDVRFGEVAERILTSYLHGAERDPGRGATQRRANVRRRAQTFDTARLMASVSGAPFRIPHEVLGALPDDGVLLAVSLGGVPTNAKDGLYAVLATREGARMFSMSYPRPHRETHVQMSFYPEDFGISTNIYSIHGFEMIELRQALLDDPLHRNVTRAGARALALFANYLLPDEVLETLAKLAADTSSTRLIFWPHEWLHFVPLHLLPFRDGILADYFTVTILPSVECLFRQSETVAAHPGVSAIACATGGLPVGLPEEPSLHEQAERIASLFCGRPLTGDDATPATALDMVGTSRYLHLAAHGTQDADAPLFARVYLAGGALHAYQILERDLRGTELVTLSACESALLRYDFLDNLHGLAPAFLRAGARAVVGALWPVEPTVAGTFFTELYAHLAEGSTQMNAFRFAQNQTRARHPNYRDWGAFTYSGT